MLTQCRKARMAGIAALLWLSMAAGCAKPAVVEPPRPVNIAIDVKASAAVNPDASGRPSPLAIRVYQLADDAAFLKADLNALWSSDATVLAASLVSRQDFMLAPGASAKASMRLQPATRQIGVAAAYRDFRGATWRAVVPAPEQPGAVSEYVLAITADAGSVSARVAPASNAGAVK